MLASASIFITHIDFQFLACPIFPKIALFQIGCWGTELTTGLVIEWTLASVYLLLYYTKGRQVAGLGLVDIQPSVDGSRHVLAGHTV